MFLKVEFFDSGYIEENGEKPHKWKARRLSHLTASVDFDGVCGRSSDRQGRGWDWHWTLITYIGHGYSSVSHALLPANKTWRPHRSLSSLFVDDFGLTLKFSELMKCSEFAWSFFDRCILGAVVEIRSDVMFVCRLVLLATIWWCFDGKKQSSWWLIKTYLRSRNFLRPLRTKPRHEGWRSRSRNLIWHTRRA